MSLDNEIFEALLVLLIVAFVLYLCWKGSQNQPPPPPLLPETGTNVPSGTSGYPHTTETYGSSGYFGSPGYSDATGTGSSGTSARTSGAARTSGGTSDYDHLFLVSTDTYGTTRTSGYSGTTGTYGGTGYTYGSNTTTSAPSRTLSHSGTPSSSSSVLPIQNPSVQPPTVTSIQSGSGSSSDSRVGQNSAQQLQLRRTVLRRFKCPFEEEDACLFQDTPNRCLFTHVGGAPNGTGSTILKEVPGYACIYHLVKPDSCRRVNNRTSQNPNSIQSIFPCINGIHLSVDQMADLDSYEGANAQTISRFFGQDAERQCGVCLETVLSKRLSRNRRFAILENCAHCFCAQCIIGWRARAVELTCPLCRIASDRVVYRRRFTDMPARKRNMFR